VQDVEVSLLVTSRLARICFAAVFLHDAYEDMAHRLEEAVRVSKFEGSTIIFDSSTDGLTARF
jgi:hypothetical protein